MDAYSLITQALESAPAEVRQIHTTIEMGNTYALWKAICRYVETTQGAMGIQLLMRLNSATMKPGESPLTYGNRLIAERTIVKAHNKVVDEEIIKYRYVNYMLPLYMNVAIHLAPLMRTKTLEEMIEMASDITTAQLAIMGNGAKSRGATLPVHYSNAAVTDTAGSPHQKGCFKCGDTGHIKANCPLNNQSQSSGAGTDSSGGNGGGHPKKSCEFCGGRGHTAEECYKLKKADEYRQKHPTATSQQSADTKNKEDKPLRQAHAAEVVHFGYGATSVLSDRRLLDSAASKHLQSATIPITRDLGVAIGEQIRTVSGRLLQDPGRADVVMPLKDGSSYELKDVLTHSEIRTSLVSVRALVDDPSVRGVWMDKAGAQVHAEAGGTIMTARRENGVFVVDTADMQQKAGEVSSACEKGAGHLRSDELQEAAQIGVLKDGAEFKSSATHDAVTSVACTEKEPTCSPIKNEQRDNDRTCRSFKRVTKCINDTQGQWRSVGIGVGTQGNGGDVLTAKGKVRTSTQVISDKGCQCNSESSRNQSSDGYG
jgi:hypothetical protein